MPYVEARTRQAANIGKLFAIVMGFLGLFGGGILLVIVAIFVYIAASDEERSTAIVVPLEGGESARDIMSRELRVVSPETTLPEIMNLMFREKHRGYPVMEGGRLAGIVTISDVQKVPEDRRPPPSGTSW